MKIAIDLNDVVRAYTAQFASYYKKNIDRTFDIDDVDIWTNDLNQVFPFESKAKYLEFLYNDFAYEIYGCAQVMDKNLGSRLSDWVKELYNLDEVPELCIISTGEYDKTIGSTHFFLSKIATKIRETHLLLKTDKVWDLCDVLITANPDILMIKPDNKISVKISATYNTETIADFNFESLSEFISDLQIIDKIKTKITDQV